MPVLGFVVLVALAWGAQNALRHLRDSVRASREQRVGQLVKQHEERYGTAATPAHRRFMAARHDTGWWTREVLHGFPVARTGYYSGWLAHRTAAEQERARRAEAAEKHEEVRESFRAAAARRASANAEEIDRATGKPAASREEVRQAAKVLPFTPRQDAPGAPEAAPEAEAAQQPAPRPEPGPYAKPAPAPEAGAGQPAETPTTGAGTAPAPSQGGTMPATTTAPETTYDDIQRSLKAEIRELHDEIARLRAKRAAWQLADALTGTLRDASTLGAFADYDDALDEQIKAVQRQLDAAESASGTLERNHGGMNEAHQSAPVAGADPRFYEG